MKVEDIKWCMEELRRLPITYTEDEQEALDSVIEMLKAKQCSDCVSREDVLSKQIIIYDDDGIGHIIVPVADIKELPSVLPIKL